MRLPSMTQEAFHLSSICPFQSLIALSYTIHIPTPCVYVCVCVCVCVCTVSIAESPRNASSTMNTDSNPKAELSLK